MYTQGQLIYDIKEETTLFFDERKNKTQVEGNPANFRIASKEDYEKSPPRVSLTIEQALDCIVDGDLIHTYSNPGLIMLGCDVSRESIIDDLNRYADSISIGGQHCRAMNHGLIIITDLGPLFVEADEEKLKKYDIIPEFD